MSCRSARWALSRSLHQLPTCPRDNSNSWHPARLRTDKQKSRPKQHHTDTAKPALSPRCHRRYRVYSQDKDIPTQKQEEQVFMGGAPLSPEVRMLQRVPDYQSELTVLTAAAPSGKHIRDRLPRKMSVPTSLS
jgi:hypothetical protein